MADVFVETALWLHARHPNLQFIIPFVNNETRSLFEDAIKRHQAWDLPITRFHGHSREVMAAADVGVRAAARRLGRFAYDDARQVAGIFGIVLLLILMAAAASLLATAGLGLIAFVPFAGVAVLPLQLAAWLLRGLLFQFLGLTAFTAYLAQYQRYGESAGARAGLRSA